MNLRVPLITSLQSAIRYLKVDFVDVLVQIFCSFKKIDADQSKHLMTKIKKILTSIDPQFDALNTGSL